MGNGNCIQEALLTAIQFANASSAQHNLILYVGSGAGICEGLDEEPYLAETLEKVNREMKAPVQINAFKLTGYDGKIREKFLRELAGSTGGRFARIFR